MPITLDTNRADLISVNVADYESGSTKVAILVQVDYRLNCIMLYIPLQT